MFYWCHGNPIDYQNIYGDNHQPFQKQNKQIMKAVGNNQIG
jgi:hypothetical protein